MSTVTAYPRISVITPVYNKAPYLSDCLNSLCAQTYPNLEILLIDDASTDGSLGILRSFAAQNARFRVLALPENVGAAGARNIGLAEATGELIGFVDADDCASPALYEKLYEALSRTGADVAACALVHQMDAARTRDIVVGNLPRETLLDNAAAMERMVYEFPRETHLEIAIWNKLYRRELIGNTRMLPINNEDYLFNYEVFRSVRRVVQIPDVLYDQRLASGSLSKNGITKSSLSAMEGNRLVIEQLQNEYPALMPGALTRYISVIYSLALCAAPSAKLSYRDAHTSILAHEKNARALARRYPSPEARTALHNAALAIRFPRLHPLVDRLYPFYLRIKSALTGKTR